MSALPFSPLTDAALMERTRDHAFMTVGALVAWADSPHGIAPPDVAIRHAREVYAYQDAVDVRFAEPEQRRPVGRVR